MLSNQIYCFYYSEQFNADVTQCFVRAVQFSIGLLCMVQAFCSFLKLNSCFLRLEEHTFGQVNNSFSRVENVCSGLSLSDRSNAKIKLKTTKTKFIITKQEPISMVLN